MTQHVAKTLLGCEDSSELVLDLPQRGDPSLLVGVRVAHRRAASQAGALQMPVNERACTVVTSIAEMVAGLLDVSPDSTRVRVRGDAVLVRFAPGLAAAAPSGGSSSTAAAPAGERLAPYTQAEYFRVRGQLRQLWVSHHGSGGPPRGRVRPPKVGRGRQSGRAGDGGVDAAFRQADDERERA